MEWWIFSFYTILDFSFRVKLFRRGERRIISRLIILSTTLARQRDAWTHAQTCNDDEHTPAKCQACYVHGA